MQVELGFSHTNSHQTPFEHCFLGRLMIRHSQALMCEGRGISKAWRKPQVQRCPGNWRSATGARPKGRGRNSQGMLKARAPGSPAAKLLVSGHLEELSISSRENTGPQSAI